METLALEKANTGFSISPCENRYRELREHQLHALKQEIIDEIDLIVSEKFYHCFEVLKSIKYRVSNTHVEIHGYFTYRKDFSTNDTPADDEITGIYFHEMNVFFTDSDDVRVDLSPAQRSFLEYEIEKHYKR
jgi:isopentenyldiphosphate isomerase